MKKIILLSLIIILNNNSVYSQSTWFWQQPLPTGNYLYSVDFVNANTGYAVGTVGTIMKTTNGGVNWTHSTHMPLQLLVIYTKQLTAE